MAPTERVAGAKVTSEFDVALNAVGVELNGASIDTLRSAPQVASVELQYLYRPLAHDDPDLNLTSTRGRPGRPHPPEQSAPVTA